MKRDTIESAIRGLSDRPRSKGEHGPELEFTGPARIYDSVKTAAMLQGSGGNRMLPAERQALALEKIARDIETMVEALHSIAKHTGQAAKRVELMGRWGCDGLPVERGA